VTDRHHPVRALRGVPVCRPSANVRGSVGVPTPGTQVVVVDPVTHARLPDGQQGLLLAAGPGVMSGYWQDAAATHKAFIDGWFDTGGWVGGWVGVWTTGGGGGQHDSMGPA
jgi:long-subunit acyl-CoA synthetase (AMP-forming)